jgi:Restriction endonuclease
MADKLIDFTEIDSDGEVWELFARDFLQEIGFFVESTPDRGADGGKDLLVTEQLQGALNNYRFRWLVSCKHYAKSNNSVTEKEELNLQERLDSFNADGFIGFYSTVPSSGLNNRLSKLKDNGKIKDFRIFDNKLIENYLIRIGFSKLLMRYLPESYKRVKPTHLICDDFIPIECKKCGKELIESLNQEHYNAVICRVVSSEDNFKKIIDVYWACKGECDRSLESYYYSNHSAITRWQDISDLVIPVIFANWILSTMNRLRQSPEQYTDEAFKKEKQFILAMCQKVLREMTDDERKRARNLFELQNMWDG